MAKPETGPWVRVLIVNYNAGALLQACVDALGAQTFADFEAVIVDNASTDGSAAALRLPDGRFTLMCNATNVGFAAANNIGARGAKTPWIATLNPDTVAAPTWLEEMRRGAERHESARMLAATLLDAADPEIVDGFGDVLTIAGIPWRGGQGSRTEALPREDAEVFAPCAAAALYARDCFEAAGGFDESFFCYVEDVDLAFRLRLAGEHCVVLRRAIVKHHGSAITGSVSAFTLYHSFRNRLRLIGKCMPPALLLVAVPLNVAVSLVLVGLLARRGHAAMAALKGLVAGLNPWAALARRGPVQRARRISTAETARLMVWNLCKIGSRPVVTLAAPRPKPLDRTIASQ